MGARPISTSEKYEEIDIEPAGKGNKNYGWRLMEGTHCFNPSTNCDMTGISLPIFEYPHAPPTGSASVTGGYVYRGSIPGLRGRYFFGDYVTKKVWSLAWDGTQSTQAVVDHTAELGTSFNISSFGQDARGEVYVVDYGGGVYRIDAK
jgi:hypothetical protein